jgi:polysaccharide export outer membrane protein
VVEDIVAAGRTPSELAREIETALSRVVRDPQVSVVITNFHGAYADQIRITGDGAKPQAVPYRPDMTVFDVMVLVGGLADFADGNRAVLVRGSSGGQQQRYGLRLKDLLKGGDISANAPVLPGDVIIVPQSWL